MQTRRVVRCTLDTLPPGRIDRARALAAPDGEDGGPAHADPDDPPASAAELARGRIVFPDERDA